MQATVRMHPQFRVGPLDPRIFGGFLEHLGRAVYEGVYDPASPKSDARGFRLDVIEALKRLNMTVMRYPGGNFVSCYDWRDGIGPKDQRPARPDFAWRSIETNQFGVDEFMEWCRTVGTAPMMAVNLGTLGLHEAGQLLEYCNLDTPTYWAQRRRDNGHAHPYGVKLWCLGNEMDGWWQAGHIPAEEYAVRAAGASRYLKGLDPSIQTVACGSSGRGMPTYLEWDRVVLEHVIDTADYLSAHRYSNNDRNDTAWFLAEGVEIDRVIADYAGLIDYVRGRRRSDRRVFVSFDEWNVWYKNREMDGRWQAAPPLLEEVYNLEDALVAAQYLMAFIRRCDVVKVACIAQVVNVIAPILTRRDGLLLQSIFYPFEMIRRAAGSHALRTLVECPAYSAGDRNGVPVVDVAATIDEKSGKTSVFLVNRSSTDPLEVTIEVMGATPRSARASGFGGEDPKAANSWEKPDTIKPSPLETRLRGDRCTVRVPSIGFATVEID